MILEHEEFLKELSKALTEPSVLLDDYVYPTVISRVITGYMGADASYSIHTKNVMVIKILQELKSDYEKDRVYRKKYENLRNSILKLPLLKKRSILKQLNKDGVNKLV